MFKGWNTAKDGSGIVWDFNTILMLIGDLILYAQWIKNVLPETGDSSNEVFT